MSDSEDEMMEAVAHRINVVYTGLFAACGNLPIPITLPDGINSAATAMESIKRVAKIAEDQPLPEEQQAALFTAAIMWLAGADLYSILRTEFDESRVDGALATLMIARDAINELGMWLLLNPDD